MPVNGPNSGGYTKVKSAARYAGVSERTFRDWLKSGLPHIKLPTGTILVAFQDIDEWLGKHRVSRNRLDEVVDDVMRSLR